MYHANKGTRGRLLMTLACVLPWPVLPVRADEARHVDLASWTRQLADKVEVKNGQAVVQNNGGWTFLLAPEETEQVELAATFTIQEVAQEFGFFGAEWNAWPNPNWADGGYEAGLLLRSGKDSGYRVQLSSRYQVAALVKYPEGSYLRVAPCEIKTKQPQRVSVSVQGPLVVVRVEGKEVIRCRDDFLPLTRGYCGVGAGSKATVTIGDVSLTSLPAGKEGPALAKHQPNFSTRKWLGGRQWVFDGDEPILVLPGASASANGSKVNCVKLKPGYKPQLLWDSTWDISNSGDFPEGASRIGEAAVKGQGQSLAASWEARNVKDQFVVRTTLTVGFDDQRQTYTYTVDSELEVLGDKPFHFHHGYDFEHHTPLDPFRWQYLLFRGENGTLYRRPVYPVDPGEQKGVYQRNGLRLWYGRHNEQLQIAPAIEYEIPDPDKRKMNTAVCAAFYDSGVAFEPETAPRGTKVRVKYRYTGYPAVEAETLFKHSTLYPALTLDPNHHYIFADEWPKLTFSKFVPMSETWIYGRTPFMTGHNQRPTYELVKDTGVGSGFAMKLGSRASGSARLRAPSPLPAGRWVMTTQCRSDNVYGPGGRVELTIYQARTDKVLKKETHFLGNDNFNWKPIGFAFEVPADAGGLSILLGNAGTGDVCFAEMEFKRLEDGAALPDGIRASPNSMPPRIPPAPAGALADYRMEEGRGLYVYNYAETFGVLELGNLDWVTDEGRPALRFADRPGGKPVYPRAGTLDYYYSDPNYKGKQILPVANAGRDGGAFDYSALSIAAWIKPAAEMGMAANGRGDIVGVGCRRFVLRLEGQQAPYRLGAQLNAEDSFTADPQLAADRWYHVAMTCDPTADKKWLVRLFLDGKQVSEGVTKVVQAPVKAPLSLILGNELYYLHYAHYRGLIGKTTVYGRALSAEEIGELATAQRQK